MIYLKLFLSFFRIGLFSIGGGYAAMPLIQEQVVDVNGWLTMTQFADIMTIAEMTPGPIAINSATFVGTQTAGLPGAVIATVGCVFPSFIIVLSLAYIYFRFRKLDSIQGVLSGLRPAVVAMIASAGVSLFKMAAFPESSFDPFHFAIFAVAFLILRIKKPNPIAVMAGAGLAGIVMYLGF